MSEATPEQDPAARGRPRGGAYSVDVGGFAGPLDLLLHLVRVNEVEITDIPIVEITRQYNEHLDLMRDFNLEIAGEYLVMAATLMHIKSRVLLPPDPDAAEDDAAIDPRMGLAQQLLDYQRFKQAAENLQALESRRSLIWTREAVPGEFEGEELLAVDMFDLMKAFRTMLDRLGEEAQLRLIRDNVSVADKITWLNDLLQQRRSIDFLELLRELPTTLDRIATFLALLEMIRMHLAVAFQPKRLGDIRIARHPEFEATPRETAEGSTTAGAPSEGFS